MQRVLFLTPLLTLAFLGLPAHAAPPTLTPSQQAEAKKWIDQLGSSSYKARAEAHRNLLELGAAAQKVLEEGVNHKDLEVRRRCEILLERATRSETEIALEEFMTNKNDKAILKLPAWQRFSKMVGDDSSSRQLFVEMYSLNGTMLAALDADPKTFGPKLDVHCQQLQQKLYTPQGQIGSISHAEVVACLFMASDTRITSNLQSFYILCNFFYQPNVQQGFKTNLGSRKLLISFLESRTDVNMLANSLQIAQQMELREAVPLALKVLNTKTTNGYVRGTAALFIGRMGTKEHVKELEPLLKDTTALGSFRSRTTQVNTQMRDVALAALVELSGQNPLDYGYPYLQEYLGQGISPRQMLPPSIYGFADDKGREAAIKKWEAFQAEQTKKK